MPKEPPTLVKAVYASLPFLLTLLLMVLTLVFTSRAFKKVVKVQTSIHAIFSQHSKTLNDVKKLEEFEIKRPKLRKNRRDNKVSETSEQMRRQFDKLEADIMNYH